MEKKQEMLENCINVPSEQPREDVAQIPGVSDYKMVLKKVVCDAANCTCMLHGCNNCPGSSALKEYHKEVFEEHSIDQVNLKQWKNPTINVLYVQPLFM